MRHVEWLQGSKNEIKKGSSDVIFNTFIRNLLEYAVALVATRWLFSALCSTWQYK